jgi:hypothetical protein
LRDPDHGDFRLRLGSPAVGYGCQTFATPTAGSDSMPARPAPRSPRQTRIDVAGPIDVDTTWNADLVRVVGDVAVLDGITLTIAAGTRVEFQDYYTLAVAGTLQAVGTPDARILFTTDEPDAFGVNPFTLGCWHGIRFENIAATNAPSRLAWCILEYSKAVGAGSGDYPYAGGAIAIIDSANVTIENCLLRHNVADYGGALFCYRNANPTIAGNLIVDNHALDNASAIYCGYAHPRIVNNTIVRNTIHNEQDPYIDTCAILCFLAKPQCANNIIRDNDPTVPYMHSQLWSAKAWYTHFNNIQAGDTTGDNIDADPHFVAPLGVDGLSGTPDDNFRLLRGSVCIDAGDDTRLPLALSADFDGVTRIIDGEPDGTPCVDMGAFEAGDCDDDGVHNLDEISSGQATDCNDNFIPDACEIERFATSLDCNATGLPDECEDVTGGDFDADGIVSAADALALIAALGGPGRPILAPTECAPLYRMSFDDLGDGDLDLRDFARLMRRAEPAR